MKKLISFLFMALFFCTLAIDLKANCSGTTAQDPLLICSEEGNDEQSIGYQQALANCCGGSQIYWLDYCNNSAGLWIIGSDGINANCSPT